MKHQRIAWPAAPLAADNNIRQQYPIHHGQWIRHPEIDACDNSFCRYSLDFSLDAAATIELHVSADNRFELYCDDEYIGMGPDRGDLDHWSFHAYRLSVGKGEHRLWADVHFLGLDPAFRPWAQMYIEPGFVLYAEDAPVDLNTGSAPWKATRLEGVTTERAAFGGFFVVGANYVIDAKAFFNLGRSVDPVVVRDAGRAFGGGTVHPGWKLYPSRLPEQLRRPVGGGRIRCVNDIAANEPFPCDGEPLNSDWQGFIEGQGRLTIAAQTRVTALWDLEEYHTAYPQVTSTGGEGASIRIEWAEACFVNDLNAEGKERRRKDNRNEIAGKYFRGYGDTFFPDGATRTFRPFWWRSGRYVRIMVETKAQPLTLDRLELLESRLPLENASTFASSDGELPAVIDLAVRGIQMCAHETYMDCPYYEQMMYVGDTRLQMLTSYVMHGEDRLNQRGLQLFDWSRQENGFVLERYPSQPKQLSCTFSMIWILMLRDYAWWRSDVDFLRQRLKGMRCLLEEFKALPQTYAPLLPPLPGWSFMDWIDDLSGVNHPGPDASVSALINLLFLNALVAAAELEESCGEAHLAHHNRVWAEQIAAAIDAHFWDARRGLFAEDPGHSRYSEHAQCLALLSGMFPDREASCFESLITADDLSRTTVYFSFYLLETFKKFGRGDLILEKLAFWKELTRQGFKTPVEMPEPSRSDCHAWGSHPLFHLHASLAGIRPAEPGFASVDITPLPGSLTELASTIPHPKGAVGFSMEKSGDTWRAAVTLPSGVEATLHWRGQVHHLGGTTQLTLWD